MQCKVYRESGELECFGEIVRQINYKDSYVIRLTGDQAKKLVAEQSCKENIKRTTSLTIIREPHLVKGPYVPVHREKVVEPFAEEVF